MLAGARRLTSRSRTLRGELQFSDGAHEDVLAP